MKKIVMILIIVIFIAVIVMTTLTLTGCLSKQQEEECQYLDDRFFTIMGYDDGGSIVVDKETGVCYLKALRTGSYFSYGYMTALLHADGTPFLYIDGEMK